VRTRDEATTLVLRLRQGERPPAPPSCRPRTSSFTAGTCRARTTSSALAVWSSLSRRSSSLEVGGRCSKTRRGTALHSGQVRKVEPPVRSGARRDCVAAWAGRVGRALRGDRARAGRRDRPGRSAHVAARNEEARPAARGGGPGYDREDRPCPQVHACALRLRGDQQLAGAARPLRAGFERTKGER
jgi:hypothetical protein